MVSCQSLPWYCTDMQCLLLFQLVSSHEVNSHEINSHKIKSHQINFPWGQLPPVVFPWGQLPPDQLPTWSTSHCGLLDTRLHVLTATWHGSALLSSAFVIRSFKYNIMGRDWWSQWMPLLTSLFPRLSPSQFYFALLTVQKLQILLKNILLIHCVHSLYYRPLTQCSSCMGH